LTSWTVVAGLSASAVVCQEFRWERHERLGIQLQVHRKLKRIPLKLGESNPDLVARYEPITPSDYIHGGGHGPLSWDLKIYSFGSYTDVPLTGPGAEEAQAKTAEQRALSSQSFADFVSGRDDPDYPKNGERRFPSPDTGRGQQHRANKARGEKLPYRWWEFIDSYKMADYAEVFDQNFYKLAAVYDIGRGEFAVIISIPVQGEVLEQKHRGWAHRMLLSVSRLNDAASGQREVNTDELFRYAETPERKVAVARALDNVSGLTTWGIFTTQRYIVLYSWPSDSTLARQRKFFAAASDVADSLNQMALLYDDYYPRYEGMHVPYSILRICATASEFHKYSGTTRAGAIGWYSRRSKELVLFASRHETEAVAFHEGWHQYSDAYFDGAELHRWFDEGTGDFFGSFRRNGRKWSYGVSKMRKTPLKALVSSKKFVPLDEIVKWSDKRFYGPGAADYYAQSYAIVDFLHRGKRSPGWDKAWNNILDTYRQALLDTRNADQAVDAAFAGIDWQKFTKSWVAWVKNY